MVGVLGEGQGAGKRWARGHHVGREQRPRYMEGAGGQDGVRESLAGAPSPVPPVKQESCGSGPGRGRFIEEDGPSPKS